MPYLSYLNCSFYLFLLLLFFLFLPSSWGYHILLDPGHGGIDQGTTLGIYRESQMTLQVSRLLKEKFDQDSDFKVTLSRNKNELLSLQRRVDLAHSQGADLFVSIHVNASSDPRVRGSEIYFKNQFTPDKETLIHTAHELISFQKGKIAHKASMKIPRQGGLQEEVVEILRDLNRNNHLFFSGELAKAIARNWQVPESSMRGIRQAPFFVVSHAHMPSILIELGFITHKREAQLLQQREYQIQIAHSIYKGIKEYKKSIRQNHYRPLD